MEAIPDLIIGVSRKIFGRNRGNGPTIVHRGDGISTRLSADKRCLSRRHISRKDSLVSILWVHPSMGIQVQVLIVGHHGVVWRSCRWWHKRRHRPLSCCVFLFRIFVQLRLRHNNVQRLPIIQASDLRLRDHKPVKIRGCEPRIIAGKRVLGLHSFAALVSLTGGRVVVHQLAHRIMLTVGVLPPHASATPIDVIGTLIHLDHD
mmetsp:Transcript_52891/g.116087  ORF Transcript_52891/g.116087 Transcript_52891/m.116087 type:complete len:204 (+) Transcript_52891:776-1387(+)